jgi:hypothetical protein
VTIGFRRSIFALMSCAKASGSVRVGASQLRQSASPVACYGVDKCEGCDGGGVGAHDAGAEGDGDREWLAEQHVALGRIEAAFGADEDG